MNAAFQCLIHTPQLIQIAIERNSDKDINKSTCASELFKLIKASITNKESNAIKPTELRNYMRKKYPQFSSMLQQDSSEFLRILLEQLNQELNRSKCKIPYKALEQTNEPIEVQVRLASI